MQKGTAFFLLLPGHRFVYVCINLRYYEAKRFVLFGYSFSRFSYKMTEICEKRKNIQKIFPIFILWKQLSVIIAVAFYKVYRIFVKYTM